MFKVYYIYEYESVYPKQVYVASCLYMYCGYSVRFGKYAAFIVCLSLMYGIAL